MLARRLAASYAVENYPEMKPLVEKIITPLAGLRFTYLHAHAIHNILSAPRV